MTRGEISHGNEGPGRDPGEHTGASSYGEHQQPQIGQQDRASHSGTGIDVPVPGPMLVPKSGDTPRTSGLQESHAAVPVFTATRIVNPHDDQEVHYEVKRDEQSALVVCTKPNDFYITWPTKMPFSSFLPRASALIDEFATKPPPSRKIELNNPAVQTVQINPGEETSVVVRPSYTGFGFDNLTVLAGNNRYAVDFTETSWPLQRDSLRRTLLQKASAEDEPFDDDKFTDDSDVFIRVNAPHFTLLHYSGVNPDYEFPEEANSFYFWSDTFPKDELVPLYEETASLPIPTELFVAQIESAGIKNGRETS